MLEFPSITTLEDPECWLIVSQSLLEVSIASSFFLLSLFQSRVFAVYQLTSLSFLLKFLLIKRSSILSSWIYSPRLSKASFTVFLFLYPFSPKLKSFQSMVQFRRRNPGKWKGPQARRLPCDQQLGNKPSCVLEWHNTKSLLTFSFYSHFGFTTYIALSRLYVRQSSSIRSSLYPFSSSLSTFVHYAVLPARFSHTCQSPAVFVIRVSISQPAVSMDISTLRIQINLH